MFILAFFKKIKGHKIIAHLSHCLLPSLLRDKYCLKTDLT